ncbi:hypothetical protein [Azohydromonas australica]|uniref:hypothetical protein n=1 Tax=Azohydromonas australica TaxID=364039 RepID=UPI0012EC9E29|nr:hypothetical protein [Azohydromonas australica]
MDKVARCHLCLSLFAAAVIALAIGMATHWSVGALLFIAWVVVHRLTWGFAELSTAPDAPHRPEPETFF